MNILKSKQYQQAAEPVKKAVLQLLVWAQERKLKSVDMAIADETYYKKTLEQRREILSAPSIDYLCKTIILENTAYDAKYEGPFYPKYICVVFQYITKFHSEKLGKFVKSYQNANCKDKASNKCFHYRLVDEELSVQLSGYEHNGVVPIQMKSKMHTIVSHKIAELRPKFFWMGGGHPVTKLRISLEEFASSSDSPVLIGDVTQ